MRLAYAKWLVEWVEEYGTSLEKGEYAEWDEAQFRVLGPALLPRAEILPVTSDLTIDDQVLSWEPEVLAGMAHELVDALAALDEKDSNSDES
jgi:hypothetical protein